jgi:protein-S-isoprenylcysteine O-methyltransferase Ste14
MKIPRLERRPMTTGFESPEQRTSRIYGWVQSGLLCVYALAYLGDSGRPLFNGRLFGFVGAVLCGLGLLLMLAAITSLRAVVQVAPEPRAGGHLVTRGPYRYFRHPIYTAILILIIGLFMRKPTLVVGLGGAVVIAYLLVKVRFEEKLLRERYADYREYERRAWGIVPGLR